MISLSCLCMVAFSGAGISTTPVQDTRGPVPTPSLRRPELPPVVRPPVRTPVPTPSVAPLEEPVLLENKNDSNIRGNGRIIGAGQFGILKNVKDRLIPGDKLFKNSKGRFRKWNENPPEGGEPIPSNILGVLYNDAAAAYKAGVFGATRNTKQGIPVHTSRYLKLNNNTDKVATFYFQLKFDAENGDEWTSTKLGNIEEAFLVTLLPGESQVILQGDGLTPLLIQKARIWATTDDQKYGKFQNRDLDLMLGVNTRLQAQTLSYFH